MTERIFKYPVERGGQVEMLKGAYIVSAGYQDDRLYVWAVISDAELETEVTTLILATTGSPLPQKHMRYIGRAVHTAKFSGEFVMHVMAEDRP